MIHLAPRRIERLRSPLLRRDPSTPRKERHRAGAESNRDSGQPGLSEARSRRRTKESGRRVAPIERTNKNERTEMESKSSKTGGGRNSGGPGSGGTVREKKQSFLQAKFLPSRLGEGTGAGSGGWGREGRGGREGRQEEDEGEERRRGREKTGRGEGEGDDDLISKWTAAAG